FSTQSKPPSPHGTARRLRPDLRDPRATRGHRAAARPARPACRVLRRARPARRHRAVVVDRRSAAGRHALALPLDRRRGDQLSGGGVRARAPRARVGFAPQRRQRGARAARVLALPARGRDRDRGRGLPRARTALAPAGHLAAAVRARQPRRAPPAAGARAGGRRAVLRQRHDLPVRVRPGLARPVGDGAAVRNGPADAGRNPVVEPRAPDRGGARMTDKKHEDASGRYAYDGLDRVMHEKARLGLLTSLAARPDGILFTDLKELCQLTDGNLSRHLTVLQEAGLVEIWKGFKGRRPQTLCRLTDAGRKRFLEY